MKTIEDLLDIMARLRDPESGCPWDLRQTYGTIVPYTLEEAYEVADAIQRQDMPELRDELGDLLFQVVFYSQLAKEEDHFTFDRGNEQQRIELLRTNRVANMIEVKDQDKFVRELSEIERALSSGEVLKPHKYIEAGQRCRVIEGSLKGTEGIAISTRTGTRLVLQVDMLGQAASVEIDTDIIELID